MPSSRELVDMSRDFERAMRGDTTYDGFKERMMRKHRLSEEQFKVHAPRAAVIAKYRMAARHETGSGGHDDGYYVMYQGRRRESVEQTEQEKANANAKARRELTELYRKNAKNLKHDDLVKISRHEGVPHPESLTRAEMLQELELARSKAAKAKRAMTPSNVASKELMDLYRSNRMPRWFSSYVRKAAKSLKDEDLVKLCHHAGVRNPEAMTRAEMLEELDRGYVLHRVWAGLSGAMQSVFASVSYGYGLPHLATSLLAGAVPTMVALTGGAAAAPVAVTLAVPTAMAGAFGAWLPARKNAEQGRLYGRRFPRLRTPLVVQSPLVW